MGRDDTSIDIEGGKSSPFSPFIIIISPESISLADKILTIFRKAFRLFRENGMGPALAMDREVEVLERFWSREGAEYVAIIIENKKPSSVEPGGRTSYVPGKCKFFCVQTRSDF